MNIPAPISTDNHDASERRVYTPPALEDLGLIHEQTQTRSDSGTINFPGGGECPLCC